MAVSQYVSRQIEKQMKTKKKLWKKRNPFPTKKQADDSRKQNRNSSDEPCGN